MSETLSLWSELDGNGKLGLCKMPWRSRAGEAGRMETKTTRMLLAPSPEELAGMIVAIAERGDRAAFARLFDHFAPRIKAHLMRGGMSAGIAEDLAQETLFSVWRKAALYNPAASGANTWIFTIARNLKIDWARRDRLVTTDGELGFESEPDPAPLADSVVERAQHEKRIGLALQTLPQEQAEVIRLAYFSDKPHSAICEELGIPLGTVKSRIRLALGRLRTFMSDEL